MSFLFDATSKDFLEVDPSVWPALLGRPCKPGSARVGDSDLSTVSTATDKVILIDDPEPWGLLLEFQASHNPDLPMAVLQRFGIVSLRYRIPFSVGIVFLRREANLPIFKEGKLERTDPLNPGSKWYFPCHVIRLWELSPDQFLSGPLSLLPFAPLTDVNQSEVPKMLDTMFERYRAEKVADLREKLFVGTYVLMGLRYNAEWVESLFKGVTGMEESSTYQLIVSRAEERCKKKAREEAEINSIRGVIRRVAGKRLGPIPPELDSRLEKLTDLEQLGRMEDLILTAASWEEMFGVSQPNRE